MLLRLAFFIPALFAFVSAQYTLTNYDEFGDVIIEIVTTNQYGQISVLQALQTITPTTVFVPVDDPINTQDLPNVLPGEIPPFSPSVQGTAPRPFSSWAVSTGTIIAKSDYLALIGSATNRQGGQTIVVNSGAEMTGRVDLWGKMFTMLLMGVLGGAGWVWLGM